MTGFGNHFATEAVDGALPQGRNSPQRPAFGLYTEQLSGSAFTAPRHENRRSWLYRMRPTADHRPFERYKGAPLFAPGTVDEPIAPNRLRWDPPELPADADFVDGLVTMMANRDPASLEDHLAIIDALHALPEQQRHVIALHYLADLPVEQIATELGVPTGTVKSRLSRGRHALASTLTRAEGAVDHV